jgi:DNA-binding transcriptional MerR regulator
MAQKTKKRYKARDICRLFDISKATLFRWERDGRISGVKRDWRNWRFYTNENVQEIRVLIRKKNYRKE